MAMPKRKSCRSRSKKRASHKKATKPAISLCPNCHEPKLAHRVCLSCGYYGENEVIKVEE
ncbi:MAG: 50S ribosomal protein L32 [Deltaproteobacteria bacterium]|nr:50S ribosomal protein L32 [Deltaproteobacteria bacterium]